MELSLGSGHSSALLNDGSVYMWGENKRGQIGDGTKVNCLTPKKLVFLSTVSNSKPSTAPEVSKQPSPTKQSSSLVGGTSSVPYDYSTPSPILQPNGIGGDIGVISPEYNYNTPISTVKPSNSSDGSYTNSSSGISSKSNVKSSKLKKPKIKTLRSSKKKTLKVTWTKVTGAKGYELRYSTKKKMGSYNAVKTTKKKIKFGQLKKHKKYYVKVRAYAKRNGKTIYSKWSKKKEVRVR